MEEWWIRRSRGGESGAESWDGEIERRNGGEVETRHGYFRVQCPGRVRSPSSLAVQEEGDDAPDGMEVLVGREVLVATTKLIGSIVKAQNIASRHSAVG